MPYNAKISKQFKNAGWKVKISEKETCEPPHMTICFKTKRWQINLRSLDFMDKSPDPSDVPQKLIEEVLDKEFINEIQKEWDKKYPKNPIKSKRQ